VSERGATPRLGAVTLIAALSAAVGLALAHALLVLPVALTSRRVPVLASVVVVQALAWWWTRRRPGAGVAALVRLAAAHRLLTLWAAVDLLALAFLWLRGSATWSAVSPAWQMVAAYGSARAALLALGIALHIGGPSGIPGRSATARGLRLTMVGTALGAPALMPIVIASPSWQLAVVSGAFALAALAACARQPEIRDRWVGLAGVLGSPALALGGSALWLGEAALPLAAPLALTSLLPALGLATLAMPVALARSGTC
jgi:hypothetical protein